MLIKFGETVIGTGNEHCVDMVMPDGRTAYSIQSTDSTELVISAIAFIKDGEGVTLDSRLQIEPQASNCVTISRKPF